MTDQHQHRATPEQWAAQQKWASPPDLDPYALCLLELRDRIAALERNAATPEPRPASAEAQPAGGLVERVEIRAGGDARAAIREVAAAASQMHASQIHPDKNLTWERVALWLEQEANQ